MGLSINSLQVETVTPEKAAEFFKVNYAHNRRVRPSWVDYLAREMREGRFMSTAEIHIMYRNGEPTMINGQHTCLAIIKYGRPVRATVRKTTTTEAGQIAMAYAFGHDNGVRRTFSDGMNAYGLSDQTGLPSESLDKLVRAISFIKNNFSGAKHGSNSVKDSPADHVKYVLFFAPVMKMFNLHVMPCEKMLLRRMRRQSSLSVALVTFLYQPEHSIKFWSQISNPDQLAWNDPRVTARGYIEAMYPRGNGSWEMERKLPRQIARCWAEFLKGNSLERVGRLVEDSAISIAGTPYTGRQEKDFLPDVDATEFSWNPTDGMGAQGRTI